MGPKKGEAAPESCDCCGRDAEDCGMLETGWVSDVHLAVGGGVYCRACSHLLRLVRLDESCVWCGESMIDEEAAEARGWVYYADSLGELHPCCPACLAGRFGIPSRVSLRRDA
jgi:hypothetical protein